MSSLSRPVLTIGQKQQWRDLTTTRSMNVTYTNSSLRTIVVGVRVANGVNAARSITGYIDGILVVSGGASYGGQADGITMIVPSGSTYLASGDINLSKWAELDE